jgi:glycosyltransferase involved in cell wall biosynthesis
MRLRSRLRRIVRAVGSAVHDRLDDVIPGDWDLSESGTEECRASDGTLAARTTDEPRRRVLLVTNRRPTGSGGRAEKVATRVRLLGRHGWEVVIGHVPKPYVRGFPASVLRCCRRAIRADVDVVNSINNPFHLHVIGYLVSRLVGAKWLAELRDPIYTHPDREPHSPMTWAAAAVERLVVARADAVVWFDGIQLPDEYFEREYPGATDRVKQLPFMGYERSKFERASTERREAFTLTYAGSFYEGWIEPYDFLAGLGAFLDARPDAEVTVQFYGDWDPDYSRAAREHGVTDAITTHEPITHEKLVPLLKGSDALVYIGGDDPGNARNLPSKVWDYVGARRPILAVIDPAFRAAGFVRDHGLGVVAPTGDPEAIGAAIAALYDRTDGYDPDPVVFEEYTRERNAARLGAVLDALIEDRPLPVDDRTP